MHFEELCLFLYVPSSRPRLDVYMRIGTMVALAIVVNQLFGKGSQQEKEVAVYIVRLCEQIIVKSDRLGGVMGSGFSGLDLDLIENLADPSNILTVWASKYQFNNIFPKKDFAQSISRIPHRFMSRSIPKDIALNVVIQLLKHAPIKDAMICIANHKTFNDRHISRLSDYCKGGQLKLPKVLGIDLDEFVSLFLDHGLAPDWTLADIDKASAHGFILARRKRVHDIVLCDSGFAKPLVDLVCGFIFDKI